MRPVRFKVTCAAPVDTSDRNPAETAKVNQSYLGSVDTSRQWPTDPSHILCQGDMALRYAIKPSNDIHPTRSVINYVWKQHNIAPIYKYSDSYMSACVAKPYIK